MRIPRHLIVLLLVILALPSPANALRIRSSVRLLAWSSDGLSFLMEVTRDGPEGGGSLGYSVHDARDGSSRAFTISSDFSPGDGSTPQAIRAAQCKGTAAELARAITGKGIKGMVIRPASCEGKRMMVVSVSKKAASRVKAGAFAPREHNRMQVIRGKIVVGVFRKRLALWIAPQKMKAPIDKGVEAEVQAYLAPKGKVVIAITRWGMHGDRQLDKVWRKKKGGWKEVKVKPAPKG